jgi:hypothetical protein
MRGESYKADYPNSRYEAAAGGKSGSDDAIDRPLCEMTMDLRAILLTHPK